MNRIIVIALILFGSLLLPAFSAAGILEAPSEPDAPDQHIVGGLIRVSGLPNGEDYSRAAYSTVGDQYLVVFEDYTNNGDFKGCYVDARSGELLGDAFTIAGGRTGERNPDVVYDPENERFLVVWQKDLCRIVESEEVCNDIIVGRLLHVSRGISYLRTEVLTTN